MSRREKIGRPAAGTGQRSETGEIDQALKDERQNQQHPRVRMSGSAPRVVM